MFLSVCICSLMFRVSMCHLFDGNDQVDDEINLNQEQDIRTSPKNLREDVSPVSHIRAVLFDKSKLRHCNCVRRYDIHSVLIFI